MVVGSVLRARRTATDAPIPASKGRYPMHGPSQSAGEIGFSLDAEGFDKAAGRFELGHGPSLKIGTPLGKSPTRTLAPDAFAHASQTRTTTSSSSG